MPTLKTEVLRLVSNVELVNGLYVRNSYTMGTSGLSDIYTRGPRVYISGKPQVPMV